VVVGFDIDDGSCLKPCKEEQLASLSDTVRGLRSRDMTKGSERYIDHERVRVLDQAVRKME
jgi:hypothetical protein